MDMKKLVDIIDFAIEREREAVEFYQGLQNVAKNPHAIEQLKDLENMERGHIMILENYKHKGIEVYPVQKIQNLKIADFLVKSEPTAETSYQDVMIIAMKREEAAFNLYSSLAEEADDEKTKLLFLKLANEEAKHKNILEIVYDDVILYEN